MRYQEERLVSLAGGCVIARLAMVFSSRRGCFGAFRVFAGK